MHANHVDPATGRPWSYSSRTAFLVRRRRARAIVAWTSMIVATLAVTARFTTLSWQPVAVFTAFSPYVGLLAFAAAFLFWLGRSRIFTITSLVVGASLVIGQTPLFLGDVVGRQSGTLNALQINVALGSADMTALVRVVMTRDVELLAVEELTPQAAEDAEAAGLSTMLPYRLIRPRPGGAGVGLWSRYPLHGADALPGFDLQVLRASVSLPGIGTTAVFAAHVLPPWPSSTSEWARELDRLGALLRSAADQGAVVALGDFNATSDHDQFRSAISGLDDAADMAGAGWMPTYPADKPWPPLLAIDHVILHAASVVDIRAVSVAGSDHRGLLVALGPVRPR